MGQVSDILFWEMGVGRNSIILLEDFQFSSIHLSDKRSMKIKTLHAAKLGVESTDTKFCLLLNAEVKNLGKKKQFG
jgi:hypothetical protein